MNYTLKILSPARADLRSIWLWYMAIRPELAADFLLCTEESMERVKRNPLSYPSVYNDIKRIVMQRFPYALFYRIKDSVIHIIAVAHTHRSPTAWQKRT
jgi:plasmid stabilization system protein ParE